MYVTSTNAYFLYILIGTESLFGIYTCIYDYIHTHIHTHEHTLAHTHGTMYPTPLFIKYHLQIVR